MEVATQNVAGAAPASFLSQLGGVLLNGVSTYVDAEVAEKIAGTNDTARAREVNPETDASQPRGVTFADALTGVTIGGAALAAVCVVVLWRLLK